MKCPKCKARIGMVPEQIATESGRAAGKLCYLCGYWIQHYPKAHEVVMHYPPASR